MSNKEEPQLYRLGRLSSSDLSRIEQDQNAESGTTATFVIGPNTEDSANKEG